MALRIVIVGPGRVGTACARRLVRAGAELLGFVGREIGRTQAAVDSAGSGCVLPAAAAASAHVVLFTVGDADLADAIAAVAAVAPPRRCSLWLHTSGRFGLEVFANVPGRFRRGALHPLVPFADAVAGDAAMAGAPAVLEGDADSGRLLRRLCTLLGLVPVPWSGGDRLLYHAACALAANGATALWSAVDDTFAAAGLPVEVRSPLAVALLHAALQACTQRGAAAALSGPVRRGDAATVSAHRLRLAERAPPVAPVYLALMQVALRLARQSGLSPQQAEAIAAALASGGDTNELGDHAGSR